MCSQTRIVGDPMARATCAHKHVLDTRGLAIVGAVADMLRPALPLVHFPLCATSSSCAPSIAATCDGVHPAADLRER